MCLQELWFHTHANQQHVERQIELYYYSEACWVRGDTWYSWLAKSITGMLSSLSICKQISNSLFIVAISSFKYVVHHIKMFLTIGPPQSTLPCTVSHSAGLQGPCGNTYTPHFHRWPDSAGIKVLSLYLLTAISCRAILGDIAHADTIFYYFFEIRECSKCYST